MAYGDINYSKVVSGSTGASANTAHLLFGAYQGLSDINNSEVLYMQMWASNNARVWDSTVTNNGGVQISDLIFDYPAVRAGEASQLHFANEVLGSNASVSFAVWKRNPI